MRRAPVVFVLAPHHYHSSRSAQVVCLPKRFDACSRGFACLVTLTCWVGIWFLNGQRGGWVSVRSGVGYGDGKEMLGMRPKLDFWETGDRGT